MPNITFSGNTSAVIKIGTRQIILQGKIGGGLSKILELSYHSQSQTLEDAIYLGDMVEAMSSLAETLNMAYPVLVDQIKNVGSQVKLGIPEGNAGKFLGQLGNILTAIDPSQINSTVKVWVTDIVLRLSAKSSATPPVPSEISIGLAFSFEGASLFNIKLVSAGVQLTVQLS